MAKDTNCDNINDLLKIIECSIKRGWVMDFKEAAELWRKHSRDYDVGWLNLYTDDNILWETIQKYMICEYND